MVRAAKEKIPEIRELTDEEWDASIDRAARYYLGISGVEFLRRWHAGEYPDPDQPGIIDIVMLLPHDR